MARARAARGCALSPAMAQLAPQLLAAAQSVDPSFRITSGCRTRAQQAALYAAFRRGESILPVAPPGRSLHELGLAVDISRGLDPYSDAILAALGQWWVAAGLGWSPSDPVHFQLPSIRERPSARAALSVDPSGDGMMRSPTPTELPAGSMAIQDLEGRVNFAGPSIRMAPLVDPTAALVQKVVTEVATSSVPGLSTVIAIGKALGIPGPGMSAVCDPTNPYNENTGGGAWPYCAIPGGLPFAQSKGWDRATAEVMAAQFSGPTGGGGGSRGPAPRTFEAGDPGVRHHLGTLKHIARQLCRVLAAFD